MSARMISVEASLRLAPHAMSLILVRVVFREIAGRPCISTAQEIALPTAVAAIRVLVCRLCGRRWMSLSILSALVIRLVTLMKRLALMVQRSAPSSVGVCSGLQP